jgi:uncharacterized protein (DUF305 family)
MTVANPAPAHHLDTATRPDGNATDVRYLEEASAALLPIMAACDAAAGRSARRDVRALARGALSVQTQQLSAISEVLRAWGRTDVVRPRTTDADALVGLHGGVLDRVFLERLTAHAHASITGARAEMVAGVSRSARPIAERAIHAQDRQVAALARLVRATARASEADMV